MVVHLDFAIAVNVDPEILIFVGTLSLGDELFQRKCFQWFKELENLEQPYYLYRMPKIQFDNYATKQFFLNEIILSEGSPKRICGFYQPLLCTAEHFKVQPQKNRLTTCNCRFQIAKQLYMIWKIDTEQSTIDQITFNYTFIGKSDLF